MRAPSRRADKSRPFPARELSQRITSALVFAVVTCLLTYAGLWPFTLLVAAGGIILAWEWGRLVRGREADTAFYLHAVTSTVVCILTATGAGAYALLALGVGTGAAGLLPSNRSLAQRLWSSLGVAYTGLAIITLVQLRTDAHYAVAAVLFMFLIVWSADTAAYVTGRTLGGPRLAPAISPGKTWSGFIGGLVVPAALAYLFAIVLGRTSAPVLALVGGLLAFSSQIGDLVESSIKRAFNVKDSGNIMPGHGGLFDRVDGLIGAALAAGCIIALRDFLNPGKALLIWP